MPSIAPRQAFVNSGQIVHLPDALERHGNSNVVIFSRVSTETQRRRNSVPLDKQCHRTYLATKEMGAKPKFIVHEQESGRMSQDRPEFKRALDAARRFDAIVVAEDRTRFLRSESSENDEPTTEELAALFDMAGGILLAAIIDPKTPLQELQSMKTKLGMAASQKKAGRPPTLTLEMLIQILKLRQFSRSKCGDESWGLTRISNKLSISRGVVQRALDIAIPNGRGGTIPLKDYGCDALDRFLRCKQQGLLVKLLSEFASED